MPSQKIQDDHRPLLVIPDSRGRVRFWHYLKALPYWRGYLALCSRSTPQDYLDYLEKRHVDFIIAGEDHVDLGKALEELSSCYGVRIVRADSGGTLNGILLRSGLVSEINVLIYPSLIGSATQNSIFRSSEISSPDEPIPLRLMHVERLKGDAVWLRYEVINERKSK